MKVRMLLISMLLGVAGGVYLVGCGSLDDTTLAVVNDYKITVQEFNDFFPAAQMTFVSAQDEFDRKRAVLDSLIITRLLVQAARERGMEESEELARVVLANKEKFLLDVLYQKEIASQSQVSETEARDFYDHLNTRLRVSQIIVGDPDTAQSLFKRLSAGESFEKLAYDYSIIPSAKKDKGDMGYVTWGVLIDEAQQVAFKMQPGELSQPIESFLGWHIIKVLDRQPHSPGQSYEQMKDQIKQQIFQQKAYRKTREFFLALQAKYPIHIDTTTCDYLMHKRDATYPPQLLATLPRNDFDLEILDRNEKELVLATWSGGQMTVAEYLSQAAQTPIQLRPDLDDYDSLAVMVFVLNRNNIMIHEAYQRGLESDPEYQRKLKLFKELTMADMFKEDSIPKPPEPDESQLRQYYDQHPDEFTTPAKVRVYEILLRDEMKANQLRQQIRNKEEFKDLAMELTERPGRRSISGDLDYITRDDYPDIFDAAWATPINQIGGPVLDRGKYSLFWVEDKIEPQLRDYLGVKREIYLRLVDSGKKDAFDTWLKERKAQASIRVNEDAIWKTIDSKRYAQMSDTTSHG